MNKKILIGILLLGFLSFVMFRAWKEKKSTKPAQSIETIQKKDGIPVVTAAPGITNIEHVVVLDARIEPNERATVMSQIKGSIWRIHVQEGDSVEENTLLVELEKAALEAAYESAKAAHEDAARNMERMETLLEKGAVSRSDYDAAVVRHEQTRFSMVNAKDDLTKCSIVSPVEGVVSLRYVDPGSATVGGTRLVDVVDISRIKVVILIPESEVMLVKKGMPCSVMIGALKSREFETSISKLSPELNQPGRKLKAVAYIDNTDKTLAPGMIARARIVLGERKNVIFVPSSVVIRQEDVAGVYRVVDGKAEFAEVETGLVTDGIIEIESGLNTDDELIINGDKQVSDGVKVLVKKED